MAYKVLITDSADRDIKRTIDYITYELHNPDAAIVLMDTLDKKYILLASSPFAYEVLQHESIKHHGMRRIVINNYVLLYHVDSSQKIVYIDRLLYGRRDYKRHI